MLASGSAFGKRGSPKKASSTDENKLGERYPRKKKALACNEGQLLPGLPERVPTDTRNQLLLGAKKAPSDVGRQYSHEAPKDIGYQL